MAWAKLWSPKLTPDSPAEPPTIGNHYGMYLLKINDVPWVHELVRSGCISWLALFGNNNRIYNLHLVSVASCHTGGMCLCHQLTMRPPLRPDWTSWYPGASHACQQSSRPADKGCPGRSRCRGRKLAPEISESLALSTYLLLLLCCIPSL